jgi:hypothetical protein
MNGNSVPVTDMKIGDMTIKDENVTLIADLSNRPNQPKKYGGDALTAAELKKKFDAFPKLIKDSFNALIAKLASDHSDEIMIDKSYGVGTTLKDFLKSIGDGTLASKLIIDDGTEQKDLCTLWTALLASIGSGKLAESLKISDEKYTTLAELVEAIRGINHSIDEEEWYEYLSDIMNVRVGEDVEDVKPLSEAIQYLYKTTPLVVDEVLHLKYDNKDEIERRMETEKGYTNSIDAISLNKEPKVGEKFWCLIKSADNYLFSAVAEIIKPINTDGFYEFKLTEANVIYDPTKTLHLNSDTEQVVDSDVKFKKDVTVEGNLKVNGENYVVDAKTLLVKDQYVICNVNDGGIRTQSGFVIITDALTISGNTNSYPAYGIVYDETFDSVRLGEGTVIVTNEGTEEQTATFTFAENASQAVATRSDSIPNGNLVKWDAENKKFVDAGVAIGDIASALDNIIAIQNALIRGDSV